MEDAPHIRGLDAAWRSSHIHRRSGVSKSWISHEDEDGYLAAGDRARWGSSRGGVRPSRTAAEGPEERMRNAIQRARELARAWYVLGVVTSIALVEAAGKRWW